MIDMKFTEYDENVSSKQLLKANTANYYEKVSNAHKDGKLICWASGVALQEFLSTMDIICVFPENHSAAVAAKGLAAPFVQYTKDLGYPDDICSYGRINISYARMLNDDAPDATEEMKDAFEKVPPLPKPDMVIITNNSCQLVPKWYGEMARYFNVPFYCIETPYWENDKDTDEKVDYIKKQCAELIELLEKICNKKFDYEKLKRIMEISAENGKKWVEAMTCSYAVPSPIDGFNYFNYLSPIVTERSEKSTLDLMNYIETEMKEFSRKGISQFKGEQKYRIHWEGIAVWPYLRFTYETMKKYGMQYVTSVYTFVWAIEYKAGDWDSMAKAYMGINTNRDFEYNVQLRMKMLQDAHVDGIVVHTNRSCQIVSSLHRAVMREVSKRTGIPVVFFDGDQCDPNLFSKAQFETRLQALEEAIIARKEAGREEE